MDIIFKRRSIRKFTNQSVPEEIIKQLLQAGMAAPSAGNEQPWQFIIITERELLDKIPTFHRHAQMIKQASIAILVCADTSLNKYDVDFWIQDCSAATQNILLAATAKGLGSVWLGVYPRKERVDNLRQLLHIPEHVVPFSLLPIGYPAEDRLPINRYKKERIHYNKW